MNAFNKIPQWQCAMCGQTWPPKDPEARHEQRKVASARHPIQPCVADNPANREFASGVWGAEHPPIDGDTRTPLEMLAAGMFTVKEFWECVST